MSGWKSLKHDLPILKRLRELSDKLNEGIAVTIRQDQERFVKTVETVRAFTPQPQGAVETKPET